jgi:hypothetical protein
MSAKVLGIGLSRTGTRSLAAALRQLDYRTADFIEHKKERLGQLSWFAGNFAADALAAFEAAVDLPIPIFFPQLDQRYPGSKFILTVREPNSWIASTRRHWPRWPTAEAPDWRYRQMLRLAMYGCHGFSEARMRYVYEMHVRIVQWYFRDRPADLLTLAICDGEGWDQLCPFLGKPRPDVPFPWLNKG